VALCLGLAALTDNRFGRRDLLRGGLLVYAINAPTLIDETDRMTPLSSHFHVLVVGALLLSRTWLACF
jgi:hypothetical protein